MPSTMRPLPLPTTFGSSARAVRRPGDAQVAALGRRQQQVGAGEVDGAVGQVGQRAGDGIERPEPGQVGRGDDQRRLPLHPPQHRPHRVARRARVGMAQRRQGEVEGLVRAALGQPQQRRRLAQRELRQVGAVAAERGRAAPAPPGSATTARAAASPSVKLCSRRSAASRSKGRGRRSGVNAVWAMIPEGRRERRPRSSGSRRPDKAGRHWGWRWAHRCAAVAVFLVVALLLGLGAFAWRLAEKPLDLPQLARRIEATVNARPAHAGQAGPHLAIGQAAIAWEGFRGGTAAPFDIRLQAVRLSAAGTEIELPEAAFTLSFGALLRGVVAPATIELRRPRLRARR